MIIKEAVLSFDSPKDALTLLAAGAAAGSLATRTYMRSIMRDRGFRVFSAPSEEAQRAVLKVTEQHGLGPRRRITEKGGGVVRALLEDNVTVINTVQPEAAKEIGNPAAALIMKAKDPHQAAQQAVESLTADGFTAEIVAPSKITDSTKGEMVFLHTDAVNEGVMLGFRQHVRHMGSMPPRWHRSA